MTSQSWWCIEYLIPTYSTLVLLLRTFLTINVDYLTRFKRVLNFGIYAIFLNIMVSQGSAATSLRHDGNAHFVVNFVLSLAVKECWKSINISRSYRHEWSVLFFSDSQCSYCTVFLWRVKWVALNSKCMNNALINMSARQSF